MINLFDKSRSPFPKDEILTKSFLIDKIANDMKMKYKKVFSLINYDEHSLKNDIHNLLYKYIYNKKREINIKYIETTILNKVREKYKVLKKPLNPINKNKNKSLIKIIYSSPNNLNSYLNLNQKTKTISAKKDKKHLSPIKNYSTLKKNDSEEKINVKENYYTNQEKNISENNINININNNENSNENEHHENPLKEKSDLNNELNEDNNKIIQIENDEDKLKKNIQEEQEEIRALEKYKEDIQNEIDEINKEIENQDKIKYLKKDLIKTQDNENIQNIYNTSKELTNNDNSVNYPSMTFEQMQYLQRKKRIEEDFYNKQNRYIFLKPRHNEKEEEDNQNNNNNKKDIYQYDNFKINKYSVDKLNEFYKIKEKIRQEKEKELRNKSAKNINKPKENEEINNINIKKKEVKSVPYEDKIQLKILQRSLDQERAIEHLRNILYPHKQILAESEYQGFNNNINDKNLLKKREYELADETRKIQIEKMKMSLDSSIGDRKKRKYEEKEIEKKYREMYEKDYQLFLQKEKQLKNEKAEKIENYRKMLNEQIEEKKKLLLEEQNQAKKQLSFDENNLLKSSNSDKDILSIDKLF